MSGRIVIIIDTHQGVCESLRENGGEKEEKGVEIIILYSVKRIDKMIIMYMYACIHYTIYMHTLYTIVYTCIHYSVGF